MKNIAPKLDRPRYEENFAEIHPPLTHNQAVTEANRCLYCYDSPCMKACPTHIDIATFIKRIATDNLKGSAKKILESNWIALTCAKACPVNVLCEGACVYNERGEKPIEIGRLQRHAMDAYFGSGMPALFARKAATGKSVGIIGGGPAGLSCAAELALAGVEVTVYEGKTLAGGLDTWGIAPYKMSYEDSLREVKLVESFGVKVRNGVRVGRDIQISDLETAHDAIFIGVGLGESPDLKIPGEDLAGVVGALEFIAKVTTRDWSAVDVGRRVAVIGAGNTAIDAATEAKRLGAGEVSIIYRRSEREMPAYEFEYALARKDGIIFHFLSSPVKIIGNGTVEAIECVRMRPAPKAAGGGRKLSAIPGSEFRIPVDMVIKSIGQHPAGSLLALVNGLGLADGKIPVNSETLQTENPKYFAGGDCINGGKEVVNAAADGKKAARGILRYLNV